MWAPWSNTLSSNDRGLKELQIVPFPRNERCVWIPCAKDRKMQRFNIFWCTFSAPFQSSLRSNYTLWGKNTIQQQLHIQKTEKKICCRSKQTFSISQEFPNCSLSWGNYISADKSTQLSLNIIRPERRWDLSLEETQAVALHFITQSETWNDEVSIRTSFTLHRVVLEYPHRWSGTETFLSCRAHRLNAL